MYYTGTRAVLEASDFTDLRSIDIVQLPEEQLVQLTFVVDRANKDYSAGQVPIAVHLTDGVTHRTLTPVPGSAGVSAPAAPAEALASTSVVSSTEAAPLLPPAPAQPAQAPASADALPAEQPAPATQPVKGATAPSDQAASSPPDMAATISDAPASSGSSKGIASK